MDQNQNIMNIIEKEQYENIVIMLKSDSLEDIKLALEVISTLNISTNYLFFNYDLGHRWDMSLVHKNCIWYSYTTFYNWGNVNEKYYKTDNSLLYLKLL